ncbi:MAG: methyltransferase domain-containing protein [Gemmatimonadota bacterium]
MTKTEAEPVASLRDHYQARFLAHGDHELATQMSRAGQRFRFEKVFEIGDLTNARVLDLGCGLGDMYPLLLERCPGVVYEGIDLVPEMTAHAAAKYPGIRFRAVDVLAETITDRFDYVLMSVVFNNALPDATEFLERLIERAFALAGKGLAFNFLSTYVNFRDAEMAYHDPARVFDFCIRRLSRKVVVQHHYERCDVAMFVYP